MEALYYTAPPGTTPTDADRSKIIVDHTDQGCATFNEKFTYICVEIRAKIRKTNGILHSLSNPWRSNGFSLNMKHNFS
jgi:hypothetical protein